MIYDAVNMQVTIMLVKLLEVDRFVDRTSILLTVFGLRQQMGLLLLLLHAGTEKGIHFLVGSR